MPFFCACVVVNLLVVIKYPIKGFMTSCVESCVYMPCLIIYLGTLCFCSATFCHFEDIGNVCAMDEMLIYYYYSGLVL